MSETTEVKTEVHEVVTEGGDSPANPLGDLKDAAADFKERYSEVIGKVNSSLEGVDWNQMGRIGKSIGILVAVIVAQILIKGVLDTINLLPVVPGLLELLGWWWWATGVGKTSAPAPNAIIWFNRSPNCVRSTWAD